MDRAANEEGWFKDPYGRHVDRWFSNGRPTRLVRDGGNESYDPPPDTEPVRPLIRSLSLMQGPEIGAVQDFSVGNRGGGNWIDRSGSPSRSGWLGRLTRASTGPLRRASYSAEARRQDPRRAAGNSTASELAWSWLLNNGWAIRVCADGVPPTVGVSRPTQKEWVHLVSLNDPDCVFTYYGSGASVEQAVIQAQERYVREARARTGPAWYQPGSTSTPPT